MRTCDLDPEHKLVSIAKYGGRHPGRPDAGRSSLGLRHAQPAGPSARCRRTGSVDGWQVEGAPPPRPRAKRAGAGRRTRLARVLLRSRPRRSGRPASAAGGRWRPDAADSGGEVHPREGRPGGRDVLTWRVAVGPHSGTQGSGCKPERSTLTLWLRSAIAHVVRAEAIVLVAGAGPRPGPVASGSCSSPPCPRRCIAAAVSR